MIKRKSPIRHKVRSHTREGKKVRSFARGSGTKSQGIHKSRVVDRDGIVDQRKLLEEWKRNQFKYMKDAMKRIGQTVPDEKIQQVVDSDAEKIQRILRDGLDVGGIIKYIERVTLEKYKDFRGTNIYFKSSDGTRYEVSRYV